MARPDEFGLVVVDHYFRSIWFGLSSSCVTGVVLVFTMTYILWIATSPTYE
jgi:hypothetical protein